MLPRPVPIGALTLGAHRGRETWDFGDPLMTAPLTQPTHFCNRDFHVHGLFHGDSHLNNIPRKEYMSMVLGLQ